MKFPRADVRTTHIKNSHGAAASPQHQPPSATSTTSVQGKDRAKLACDECRKRKLKCNTTHPCRSCCAKRLKCHVSKSSRPPGRPRNDQPGGSDDQPQHLHLTENPEIPAPPIDWHFEVLQATNHGMRDLEEAQDKHGSVDLLATAQSHTFVGPELFSQVEPQIGPAQGFPFSRNLDNNSAAHLPSEIAIESGTWGTVELLDDQWQLPPLVSPGTLLPKEVSLTNAAGHRWLVRSL